MTRGPVLTLVAVVVLGLVLWGADAVLDPSSPASSSAGAPQASAPAAPPTGVPADVQFVGYAATDQGQVPMAVTVDDGRTKMYVCDGRKVEAWMQGSASQGGTSRGALDARGRGGNHASATFSGNRLTGSMHVDGQSDWKFEASATKDEKAGIYRRDRDGVSGWVVFGKDDGGKDAGGEDGDDKDGGEGDRGTDGDGKDGDGGDESGKGGQWGLTRDLAGGLRPAPPLPLDGGPLPAGVAKVDAGTDVLPD